MPRQCRLAERRENLWQTLLLDMMSRYKIRNETAIRLLLRALAERIGELLSYNELSRILQEQGLQIGVSTVLKYIRMLEDRRIIHQVLDWQERTGRSSKQCYYFYDNGLLAHFLPETNRWPVQLRNAKALDTLRNKHDREIYCHSTRNIHIDFYIPSQKRAFVLCPDDDAKPEALRNLRRFKRKFPDISTQITLLQ